MWPKGTLVAFSGDGSGSRRWEVTPARAAIALSGISLVLLALVYTGWQLGEVAARLGH